MAWDTDGTQRRLRDAALVEFAARGFEGTTVAAIAARSGANKERLATAVELTGTSLDDIGEFAGATYDYHAAHPELGRLLQWEGLQEGPPAHAAVRATHYLEKVARFAAAQRDGHLDPDIDPGHLVFVLIALAAWWQTVPQLAEMITRATPDDLDERAARRRFVVEAARRIALPARR